MTKHVDPAELLAWARTKPAQQTYDYTDQENCALAQFLVAQGHTGVEVAPWQRATTAEGEVHFGPDLENALVPTRGHYSTFGALAERLEELVEA